LKTNLSLSQLEYNKLKSENERDATNHSHEVSKLSREVTSLTDSLEAFRSQKADLSKDVEVYKVKLAELQARLSETQSDLSSHKEKEKVFYTVIYCSMTLLYVLVLEYVQF